MVFKHFGTWIEDGYMVRYIVGFSVSYNHFYIYGYCIFMIIFTTLWLYIFYALFLCCEQIQVIIFVIIMSVKFLSLNFILLTWV